jgi:hypothetical protein
MVGNIRRLAVRSSFLALLTFGAAPAVHAEDDPSGTVVWHAPRQVFLGNGIKIGNVLAVAYAYSRSPAIAPYCWNGRQLEGSWWTGPDGRSGKETLKPKGAAGAELSTLPQLNSQSDPRDPCNTPVAANF